MAPALMDEERLLLKQDRIMPPGKPAFCRVVIGSLGSSRDQQMACCKAGSSSTASVPAPRQGAEALKCSIPQLIDTSVEGDALPPKVFRERLVRTGDQLR